MCTGTHTPRANSQDAASGPKVVKTVSIGGKIAMASNLKREVSAHLVADELRAVVERDLEIGLQLFLDVLCRGGLLNVLKVGEIHNFLVQCVLIGISKCGDVRCGTVQVETSASLARAANRLDTSIIAGVWAIQEHVYA